MTALSMVPLMLIVSGSVDMARAYLAREQLQGACDAGVLAARKFQSGFTLSSDAGQIGQRFFQTNYPNGYFGTKNASFSMTVEADGSVKGDANVETGDPVFNGIITAPTRLSVSCAANLEMGNTDIVFALDVTGSMNDRNPGDSISRKDALRASVKNFTTMLNGQSGGGAQMRFGFVPFSSTVNVGYLLKSDWIVDNWTYQSREADPAMSNQSGSTPPVPVGGSVNETTYDAPSYWEPSTEIMGGGSWQCVSVPPPTTGIAASSSPWVSIGGGLLQRTNTQIVNGNYYEAEIIGRRCVIHVFHYINYTLTSTETRQAGGSGSGGQAGLYYWIYKPVRFNVAPVKTGNHSMVVHKFSNDQNDVTIRWGGCIEERDTVRTIDFSPLPAQAYDLDIDLIPNSDATRWRPFLPGLVYWRRDKGDWDMNPWHTTLDAMRPEEYANGLAAACPTRARKLSVLTQQEVKDYVDALTAGGTTYLDIGMIWAARLASPTGLFARENASAPNGKPISGNIIFMTDGNVETHDFIYEAYGLGALDRRRSDPATAPTDAGTDALVEARFRAACEAAKAKGLTVWTIAFGTALTPALKACASNNHYFMANNNAELDAAFSTIAGNISRLRLIK